MRQLAPWVTVACAFGHTGGYDRLLNRLVEFALPARSERGHSWTGTHVGPLHMHRDGFAKLPDGDDRCTALHCANGAQSIRNKSQHSYHFPMSVL